jgi:hypothetical protein
MYKMTDRRLATAKPILEKYRAQLFTSHSFDTHAFERELRDAWSTGYREIKDVVTEIAKKRRRTVEKDTDRYREVAAYYMQNNNGACVASEFQRPLAELYGITHYDANDREQKRAEYWENVFDWGGTWDRMDEDEE